MNFLPFFFYFVFRGFFLFVCFFPLLPHLRAMLSLAGFPGICPECGGLLALAIDSSVVVCSKSTLSLPANKYSVTNQLR